MPVDPVISSDLAAPNGHFSQATTATAAGRLVFVSGMTARDSDGSVVGVGDVTAQAHQVCRNIAAAMRAAGGSLDDVARLDVYVRDIRHFEAIHAVRRRYFTGVPPASTMVEVSGFVNPDYLVEMSAIGVLPAVEAES